LLSVVDLVAEGEENMMQTFGTGWIHQPVRKLTFGTGSLHKPVPKVFFYFSFAISVAV
jgi:hypothetical protein